MQKRILNFLVIALGTLMLSSCSYNNIISLDEGAKKAWADVEAAYQRRTDLIGNLVETVKGEAKFEKETLTAVIEARAKATSIQLKADDITPENMAKFQEAQSQLGGALSRLLVTMEKYPDLYKSIPVVEVKQGYFEVSADINGKFYGLTASKLIRGYGNENGIDFFTLVFDSPDAGSILKKKINFKTVWHEIGRYELGVTFSVENGKTHMTCDWSD